MMDSKWWAALSTYSRRSAWAGVTPSRRSRWVRPRMAFMGVRISWLMLARKALLARPAASAWVLARVSSAVRWATSSSRWWR